MIVRILRAQVRLGREADYLAFLRAEAVPLLRSVAGQNQVEVGLPSERSPHEFTVISRWESVRHLREFAGERWFRSRILPAELALVRATAVHHYESLSDGALLESDAPPQGASRATDGVLEVGRLIVDLLREVASLDGREIELPPREFLVLAELARQPSEPRSATELAEALWPDRPWATPNDVRRVVYRLRRRLGGGNGRALIRNRRGYGYVLDVPPVVGPGRFELPTS